jgi:thiol-disulfide isomerase/thioredoxin
MKELQLSAWREHLFMDTLILFVYTPLCGTCKVAFRMLEVVEHMLPDLPLFACNLNLMPEIAREWKIESVPCLVVLKRGVVREKRYAMRSVESLYEWMKRWGQE